MLRDIHIRQVRKYEGNCQGGFHMTAGRPGFSIFDIWHVLFYLQNGKCVEMFQKRLVFLKSRCFVIILGIAFISMF
jgi:hypothetical protein